MKKAVTVVEYLGPLSLKENSEQYTECFKKSFSMVFQMLPFGECYEIFTLKGVQNYPSLNT
jgi:hypothetical protein